MHLLSPRGGLIRAARRPPGFVAAGPRPAEPSGRPELLPGPGEDLCWLAGDWRILQRTGGHRFSLDDFLTAHAAAAAVTPRSAAGSGRHLDLGCGIGSVLLFVAWRLPTWRAVGIEAQEASAELARRSIAWNGCGDRCTVRSGDFRAPAVRQGLGTFDLVTGTPPYFPPGGGSQSSEPQRAACRFEHRGGVEDYCRVAAEHLAPGAPLVACAAAGQRARVEAGARAAGLAIEWWQDVVPRQGKPPRLAVFRLRHAAVAGPGHDAPPLVVRDRSGRRTPELQAARDAMGMP